VDLNTDLKKAVIMSPPTSPLVLPFTAISAADLPIVGGKGANLGEMTRAGFPIPSGFCITIAAFQQFLAAYPQTEEMYCELESLGTADVAAVRRVGEKFRSALTAVPIPTAIRETILTAWQKAGTKHSYAVRSSATAEDLPDASFAGQQDTYLNVRGEDKLLDSVRRCPRFWVLRYLDIWVFPFIQKPPAHVGGYAFKRSSNARWNHRSVPDCSRPCDPPG
jgi:pyruvate,water dikinase